VTAIGADATTVGRLQVEATAVGLEGATVAAKSSDHYASGKRIDALNLSGAVSRVTLEQHHQIIHTSLACDAGNKVPVFKCLNPPLIEAE
jgi:hypothetical protein